MKELIINLKKWYRGKGSDNSRLRLSDGRQCCLGFYLRACGVRAQNIESHATPGAVSHQVPDEARWLLGNQFKEHSNDCQALMNFNDREDVSESVRRQQIVDIFRRHDVVVKFKK